MNNKFAVIRILNGERITFNGKVFSISNKGCPTYELCVSKLKQLESVLSSEQIDLLYSMVSQYEEIVTMAEQEAA